MVSRNIVPVILSGGSGTRLWPLSRTLYPKQLLALAGPDTMLQATAKRLAGQPNYANPILVAGEDHRFIIAEQLRAAGVEPQAILLEPAARNTAPAIALAAAYVARTDPDALLLVMPSDHIISDANAFASAVAQAAVAAQNADLVTFGVKPGWPETGYGYIETGDAVSGAPGVKRVKTFVEKPNEETAKAYLAAGTFVWNSGIFCFTASAYLSQLETHEPEMSQACTDAIANGAADGWFFRPDKARFLASPSNSIDYAVMEKVDCASVVPVDMGWNDVGSWSALWDLGQRDGDGNVLQGDVLTVESRNSYIRSEGPLIATVGVDDLVVVATDDAVLVARRDRAQDVKSIIDQLKSLNRDEHKAHVVIHRPWGTYQTTDKGERFQTKRIVVKPGEKLSLQKHHHRAEHWIVVQGTAKVTKGSEVVMVYENESTYIPIGETHRLENPGKIPLHLIEVQSGAYLGEDDIVRFEDTYGRV
jgi:mannose-1-phosphate guanylyltransferase / mannose-6-phosphate isomerase